MLAPRRSRLRARLASPGGCPRTGRADGRSRGDRAAREDGETLRAIGRTFNVNQAADNRIMAIPDYQTLMLPVLRLAANGERRVVDIVDHVADELGLSDEERETPLPSGRQRVLHNRIHRAKFYVKGGAAVVAWARPVCGDG